MILRTVAAERSTALLPNGTNLTSTKTTATSAKLARVSLGKCKQDQPVLHHVRMAWIRDTHVNIKVLLGSKKEETQRSELLSTQNCILILYWGTGYSSDWLIVLLSPKIFWRQRNRGIWLKRWKVGCDVQGWSYGEVTAANRRASSQCHGWRAGGKEMG